MWISENRAFLRGRVDSECKGPGRRVTSLFTLSLWRQKALERVSEG